MIIGLSTDLSSFDLAIFFCWGVLELDWAAKSSIPFAWASDAPGLYGST